MQEAIEFLEAVNWPGACLLMFATPFAFIAFVFLLTCAADMVATIWKEFR